MLLRLVSDIRHDVLSNASAAHPVQQTPRAKIPLLPCPTAAAAMHSGATRDPAHQNSRHDAVPRHGERLLRGRQGGDEQKCEQVRAQHQRRQVERDEAVQQERDRVVGAQQQRVGGRTAAPGVCTVSSVPPRDPPAVFAVVQDVAVDEVGEDLAGGQHGAHVLDDGPGERQRRRGLQQRALGEQSVGRADAGLDRGFEREVHQDQADRAGQLGGVPRG